MSEKESNGIGFWSLLQVALIVLRLMNVIQWNWLLVLLPVEIEIALFLVFYVLVYMDLRSKKK